MENLQSTGAIVRKVCLMTLIGVGVVFLAGPALAVVGTLLPFALIGALVWVAVQAVVAGPRVAGRTVRAGARTAFRLVSAGPIWLGRNVIGGVGFMGRTVLSLLGFAFRILLPTVAGLVLGAVLGLIGGIKHDDAEVRIPAGAVIGAGVGFLAGALRGKKSTKTVAKVRQEQPPMVQPVEGTGKKRIAVLPFTNRFHEVGQKPTPQRLAKVVLVSETRE
jgi:hypothetical protein